ncbi:MAG: Rieske (2Fe-2S) protein [Deltaproteobacteria bacterium]|nr:Rieske (2Fe-2S) protein [Deltaproteobacteria bacterium]MBW2723238.1 Rieske (2Fe-2S) protein [Deltaproteobacteria bacterium]
MNADLSRNPALTVVATYRRAIGASLERVWENVLDWEHLPWLHSRSFADIRCEDAGEWGWRAEVRYPGTDQLSNIELSTDRDASRYVTRVLDGPGSGGEIWTTLSTAGEHVTDIVVEFCAKVPSGVDAKSLGDGYLALYERLWDEDETMMQQRQTALDGRGAASELPTASSVATPSPAATLAPVATPPPVATPIVLGSVDEVRSGLPLHIEALGVRMRIIEIDGAWVLHSLTCPHLLGPLDDCEVVDGKVTCPWHGYRFDLASGRSCDGRRLRLACPFELEVDRVGDRVRLVPRAAAGSGDTTP